MEQKLRGRWFGFPEGPHERWFRPTQIDVSETVEASAVADGWTLMPEHILGSWLKELKVSNMVTGCRMMYMGDQVRVVAVDRHNNHYSDRVTIQHRGQDKTTLLDKLSFPEEEHDGRCQ